MENLAVDTVDEKKEEDANSIVTTGHLVSSAMFESGEFLFEDDPCGLLGTPNDEGSAQQACIQDDELLLLPMPSHPLEEAGNCSPVEKVSKPRKPSEQQTGGKPAKKTPTTSDETVTLSTENSELPVPEIIYVFCKVPLNKKSPSKLRKFSNSMRIKMGFKQKSTLDEDDPEVYKETLVDL